MARPIDLHLAPRIASRQRRSRAPRRRVPPVAICVLVYGDYPALARQAVTSILERCPRQDYSLIVGANSVGAETRRFLEHHRRLGAIDRLIVSETNLNKCPMMRRMFQGIRSEFIWWFDDDCHVQEASALTRWLERARNSPSSTVMWGRLCSCKRGEDFTYLRDPVGFVREASWYAGLPPPSWRPGGKGEFNYNNEGTGDGQWLFVSGGCWMIRTSTVRALDWPDRRLAKMGDDVFLGEAVRQHGWRLDNLGTLGIVIGSGQSRGALG